MTTMTKEQFIDGRKVENRSEIGPKAVFLSSGQWIAGTLTGFRDMPPKNGRKGFRYYHLRIAACDCVIAQGVDNVPVSYVLGQTVVGVTGAWLDTAFGPHPEIGGDFIITYKGLGEKKSGQNPAKEFVVEQVRG